MPTSKQSLKTSEMVLEKEIKSVTTAEHQPAQAQTMVLPITVVSLIDLGRLQRELAAVEVFLEQATARAAGQSLSLPRLTHNLDATAQANKLNLLVDADRQKLATFLAKVRDKAPVMHISFASDPSAAFLQKIVSWFRTTIHPLVILQVGLQPTIAAGCVLRTSNKYFDLSLRRHFAANRKLLVEKIGENRSLVETPPPKMTPVQPEAPAEKEYTFVKPTVTTEQPAASVANGSGGTDG